MGCRDNIYKENLFFMRRKDCEIKNEQEIIEIIKKCDVVRIGMIDEDGYAYIVPVNFGMEIQNEKCFLYFHSAMTGKKIDLLKENARVSFEMDTAHKLHKSEKMPEITYHYQCVMGNGHVRFITEPADREKALNILMCHYTHKNNWEFPETLLKRVNVLCLEIEEWSAKKH